MPDQSHYAAALSEIASQQVSAGLFAQCFSKCKGDEQKTKALYIERRAIEFQEIERQSKVRKVADDARLAQARQIYGAQVKFENIDLIERVRASLTISQFEKEMEGKILFDYYNSRQIAEMHQKWQFDKLRSQGLI